MEPGNRYYCEFAAEGWGSQDYTITLTEPLECNNEQTAVLLSKQALASSIVFLTAKSYPIRGARCARPYSKSIKKNYLGEQHL